MLTNYSLTGDVIWSVGPLKGGNYIGGQLPGTDYESIRKITAAGAATNGGLTVAGPLNVRQSSNAPVQISANGQSGSWSDRDLFASFGNDDFPRDLIGTSDGGFIILYSIKHSDGPSSAVLRRYNAAKQFLWTRQIDYPNPNPPTPNLGLTKGTRIVGTPDGGFLIVGFYNRSGTAEDKNSGVSQGWMAKLDADGNVSWQKLISATGSLSIITDAIISADGAGYVLVGHNFDVTRLVEIDFNGDVKIGRVKVVTGLESTNAYITTYTGSGGKKFYAVGNTAQSGRLDPQIRLVDQNDLSVVASRTFPGPGQSRLTDIATAGDGSLVYVTDNNQLVKLQPEAPTQPPTSALTLTAPTYNCQTGAITFNTSGGDGTLIEYMAPGITGWTTNPNQILDGCARTCADTPPFLISARQSGKLVTYMWSRQTHCANPTDIVKVSPIANITATVGQGINFPIGLAFSSSVTTSWSVDARGLPPGVGQFFRQEGGGSPNPTWLLIGTPTTAGVYSVTASASANGGSASTTFQFIVTNGNAGNPFALTTPTYNCATGAITFNTSGGNGSPIEYMAPGITGWTTNPNQFVDRESRTALDVQPFTLMARQNGVTVTYVWDLRAYCNGTPPPPPPVTPPPTGGSLTLVAPTYNCATGAFTFNTSGGNGSPIEYQAPGITGWTTNPNQFVDTESRTALDVQPFTLMARQNGVTVSYVWDLKAACGRSARTAALPEAGTQLQVRVLGNPVLNQTAELEVTGADQQVLQLNLVDLQGRVLHQQRIEQAESVQRVRVPMGAQSGVFLLNVSTPTQQRQLKLLKP